MFLHLSINIPMILMDLVFRNYLLKRVQSFLIVAQKVNILSIKIQKVSMIQLILIVLLDLISGKEQLQVSQRSDTSLTLAGLHLVFTSPMLFYKDQMMVSVGRQSAKSTLNKYVLDGIHGSLMHLRHTYINLLDLEI